MLDISLNFPGTPFQIVLDDLNKLKNVNVKQDSCEVRTISKIKSDISVFGFPNLTQTKIVNIQIIVFVALYLSHDNGSCL